MKNQELESKLVSIDERLKSLGDLSELLQKSQGIAELINDAKIKKEELSAFLSDISISKDKLDELILESTELNESSKESSEKFSMLSKKAEELQEKVSEVVSEVKVQLGIAANSKLASTFENVADNLSKGKKSMFWWLFGAVIVLVLATSGIVFWQIRDAETIYAISFIVRIALLSPIVYFIVFINREYSRLRNLIEEYIFKASIARSFEAYREIVQGSDTKNEGDTLKFVLKSIEGLYSSPMVNIKKNINKEKENSPDCFNKVTNVIEGKFGN